MKHDALIMALLYDYYGELLTEKQRTCFDLYYNQDLSLAEIAEQEGISRQGVHDAISRAETLLRETEQAVGCVARSQELRRVLSLLRSCEVIEMASEGRGLPVALDASIRFSRSKSFSRRLSCISGSSSGFGSECSIKNLLIITSCAEKSKRHSAVLPSLPALPAS